MNDTRDSSRLEREGDPLDDVPFVAGRYPSELETDIIVRTGATLHLRPIRGDDATKLIAFHHRLSFNSIYRRYFSVHPELSPAEVAHLTEVDYVDRLALVIEDGDELVGVGRYDRYPRHQRRRWPSSFATTTSIWVSVIDYSRHWPTPHARAASRR